MPKFNKDMGMYFLFSTHVIEETAYVYELRYTDIILFMWCHYSFKYLLRGPYYNFNKIQAILDHVRIEIPHSNMTLKSLFVKLEQRGLVDKINGHYITKDPSPLITALTQRMRFRVESFNVAASKEGGMPEFRHPLKHFKKRRRGRVTGYRKKHKNKIIYTCKVPYKSKTDKLFK